MKNPAIVPAMIPCLNKKYKAPESALLALLGIQNRIQLSPQQLREEPRIPSHHLLGLQAEILEESTIWDAGFLLTPQHLLKWLILW